jgi:arsenate reductase
LFICLGNSCRSIMAEALSRHLCRETFGAASAGISPLGFIAPETLAVLAEVGIDPAGLRSKGLAEVNLPAFRLLVNLTRHRLDSLLPPSCHNRLLQRQVPDPYGGPLAGYRQTRDLIQRLILAEIAPLLLAS